MIEFYHSMGISSYELFQVILCALGIGMAKTGLGGIGLLVVPIMAGIFGPKESTGILLIILILADIFGVGFYYRHAEINKLIQLAPSTLLGILIGVLVGDRIDAYQFRFVMGTVVIIGAVLMTFQPNNKNNGRVSFFYSYTVGSLAGFSTMVGNAAGPIMTIYFLSIGFQKNKFIGTTAWFFLLVNIFKVPFHMFFWKTIDLSIILFDLSLFPVIIFGALLGVYIVKRIPEKPYRIILILSVFLSTAKLFI